MAPPPFLFLLLLLPLSVTCLSLESCDTSTNEVVINPLAQAHIGVVLPLREAGTNGYGCGSLNENVEYVEAINWALQRLNQNSGSLDGNPITDSYVPGVQLGVRVSDSCSRADFSTHSVVQELPSLYSTQQACQTDPSQIFLGYIGEESQTSSQAVSNLLQLQGVPQVSFSTSASTLSDKTVYPQFLRTAPTIKQYAEVYIALLKALGWEQVGVIHTMDVMGQDTYMKIRQMSKGAGICIVRHAGLMAGQMNEDIFKNALIRMYDAGLRTLVYVGDTDVLSQLFTVAKDLPEGKAMQWVTSVGTDKNFALQFGYNRGMVTLAPHVREISEFREYWAAIDDTQQRAENPWYQEWYMTVNRCKLPGITQQPFAGYDNCDQQTVEQKRDSFSQNMYTEAAVLSLYSYAKALKTAHSSLCQGSPGICDQLAALSNEDFTDYLKGLDFTFTMDERIPSYAANDIAPYNGPKKVVFDANGDLSDIMFDVFNYKLDQATGFDFIKVGSYMAGMLELSVDSIVMYDDTRNAPLPSLPMSLCPQDGCQECYYAPAHSQEPGSMYMEGDILLAGLFGVRSPGGKDLMCGDVTNEGFQIAESVIQAINVVNDKKLLGDIKLGSVIFDHCSSPLIDTSLLIDFNKRGMVHGQFVNPDNVQFYIGGYTPPFGVEENRVLKEFGFPLVYYGPEMDDKPLTIIIPHEVSHDSSQPLAMLVNRLGQKYVQIIYQKPTDVYSTFPSVEKVQAALTSLDICVAEVYVVSDAEDYPEAISCAAMVTDASAIVTVGNAMHLQRLFDAIQGADLVLNFTIISTAVWWQPSLQDYEDIDFYSLGSSTTSIPNQGLLDHLDSLDVETYGQTNPWFNEWYEMINDCYILEASSSMYSTKCPSGIKSTDGKNFRESLYSIMSMNAVYSAVTSIRKNLVHFCGDDFSSVCAEYRNAEDRVNMLVEYFDTEIFHDAEGNILDFSDWPAIITTLNVQMADQGAYQKIGKYTIAHKDTPAVLELTSAAQMPEKMSTCSAPCLHCHYLDYPGDTMVQHGDLYLAGLFDVHTAGSDKFLCGDVSMMMAYQHYETFRYAIDMVNSGEGPVKLNNVKIGSIAFDACESGVRSSSLLTGFYSGAIMEDDVTLRDVVGWIDGSKAMVTVLGDTASALNVPVIGPNTDRLEDAEDFSTYFMSMTGVEEWSTGVLEILERMGWSYIHVVVDDSPAMQTMYEAFRDVAQEKGICTLNLHRTHTTPLDNIIVNILSSESQISVVFMASPADLLNAKKARGVEADDLFFILGSYMPDMTSLNTKGVLTVLPDIMAVPQFDDFVANKTLNKDMGSWFQSYYKALYDCDFGLKYEYGVTCDPDLTLSAGGHYVQDMWLSRTINSVYAMTAATHKVLQDVCGQNYQGVCMAFKESTDILPRMVDALKTVSFTSVEGKTFTFDENHQFDQGYNVYISDSAGDFGKYAFYRFDKLTVVNSSLSDPYSQVTSGCGSRCSVCQGADTMEETFTFIPGDILLGGVFDIHKEGSSPFTCADLNTRQGYQLLEAFNYAINHVNKKTGLFEDKLNGVQLGGFGLDGCKSSTRVGNSLANIHSGAVTLTSGTDQVDPDRIVAYVGGFDSDTSMRMSDVLTSLGVPQISYGATSVTLKNTMRYPLFLRTVPSNDRQADALVAFLTVHGIDNIQVVHDDTLYGNDGVSQFSQKAQAAGICISRQWTLTSNFGDIDINANKVVHQLLTRSDVNVVVVFLAVDHILPFLQAVQRKDEATASFRFIGSETWADNAEFLDEDNEAEEVAKTSISFSVETSDIPDFDSYLNTITQTGQDNSEWFREYYEYIYDCSLLADITSPDRCNNPNQGIASAPNYVQDQYALYTINAVFAAALGIDSALKSTCGDTYNGLCPQFVLNSQQRQSIFTGIKDATFPDSSGQLFMFSEDGESNRGFQLYDVQDSQAGGIAYRSIGSYEKVDGLKILDTFTLDGNWDSACDVQYGCFDCLGTQPKPTDNTTGRHPLTIVGFFDVHYPDDTEPLKCGRLNIQGGFQNMLAFHYVFDRLLTSDKVKGLSIDTCGSSSRVHQGVLSLASGEETCDNDNDGLSQSDVAFYLTIGNADTAAVTGLIGNDGVLTISPSATASSFLDLGNFLSAVPPDTIHAQIMSEVTKQMDWVYVSVIYSADLIGQRNVERFVENSKDSDQPVCVGVKWMLPQHTTFENAKFLLSQLQGNNKGATVLVLFVTEQESALLLQAANDLGLLGSFLFLGSELGKDESTWNGMLFGSLTIEPITYPLVDFYTWVNSLTEMDHGSVPDEWFTEYFPLYALIEDPLAITAEVYYTILSTQLGAQAVIDMDSSNQLDSVQLGDFFRSIEDPYSDLYDAVRRSSVNAIGSSENFRFTDEGYGNLGLNIYNYRMTNTSGLKKEKIGSWNRDTGVTLDKSSFLGYTNDGEPKAQFSSQCFPGQTCSCEDGTGIDGSDTGGYLLSQTPSTAPSTQEYTNSDFFSSPLGIILTVLTALGILFTILLFVYLLIFYPVKGGTSAIGFLLLFGVLLLYVLNFAFLVYPSYDVCGIRRFCLGLVYALVFACMLVKVLNTWRIGDAWDEMNPPTYERLSHPCSLVAIVIGLTLVQVIIGAEWLILRHPDFEMVEYEGKMLPRCSPSDTHNEELVMSCIYVMFLILLTMVYAAVTWDSEESNKESRWILVVSLFTIIIWIVWTIITTLASFKFRDPAIVLANLVNATVILLCIYIRKLYLLNKIQKEIDDERKSQFSTISREKPDSVYLGNGYYVNPAYRTMEVGSLRSNKSSQRSQPASHHSYNYDRNPPGADVAY